MEVAIEIYRINGWNVAEYSRRDFREMARSHSLFVQHVKQDGILVRDDQGFLQGTLNLYRPSLDYTDKLAAAINPIRSIRELEKSYWGKLFQADILYVSVRNACILYKATVSEPDFDFANLVAWISSETGLNLTEQNALLRLRSLKHAYRARMTNIDVSEVGHAAYIAQRLADYWESFCGPNGSTHALSNGYFEVRALEGELVRAVGPVYMDELGKYHELGELWSTICSTDPYRPRPPHLQRWSKSVSDFMCKQKSH
ncbi:hypothetical protein FGG78_20820 [Thioclava sp. BHET1]|nr:hypothetical protein FGG78_20820 [Thioclava sp. BHET1]